MNYALIINAFASDHIDQVKKLSEFLTSNKLELQNGIAFIIYDPETSDTSILNKIADLLPVGKIICAAFKEYIPEHILNALKPQLNDTDCIFLPGSRFGDELAVRLSVRLGGSSLTGALDIALEKDHALIRKKIYSGHMIGTFCLEQRPYVISIDKNISPDPANISSSEKEFVFQSENASLSVPDIHKIPVQTDSPLENSSCITVVGRGLKNKENVLEVKALSDKISVPAAGSRPCVMSAWLPLDLLIGVSGTMIAPEVCILLGISGAPALYSGIEKSKYIISVNTDPEAPINKKADLSICGDALSVYREFIKLIEEDMHEAHSSDR